MKFNWKSDILAIFGYIFIHNFETIYARKEICIVVSNRFYQVLNRFISGIFPTTFRNDDFQRNAILFHTPLPTPMDMYILCPEWFSDTRSPSETNMNILFRLSNTQKKERIIKKVTSNKDTKNVKCMT